MVNLMNVYRAPDIPIEEALHQTFTIALEANPTTGYTWKPDYDSTMLECLNQDNPDFVSQSGAIGGGGEESFKFKTLQPGETQVKMSYQREWEAQPKEAKFFKVRIIS